MSRVRAFFTWPVAGPVVAYLVVALLCGLVVDAFVARREASDALKAQTRQAIDARKAGTREIHRMQAHIDRLQTQLAHAGRERGRLEAAIAALAEQIRQQGGTPVTTGDDARPGRRRGQSSSPSPSPAPSSSSSPSPRPTPGGPPSPLPTPVTICARVEHHRICTP